MTGKKPAKLVELDNTPFPEELGYLYQWFTEFYNGQSFSYGELEAWCRLTCRQLEPSEVEIIRHLVLMRERN